MNDGMNADVLSDVLRAVRLTGAVYFDFDLSSPWVLEAPRSRDIAGLVMPGAQRVIHFHLMARGSGWGHPLGQPPRPLREGDLLAFPHGDAHVLSSAPGMRATPNMQTFAHPSTPLPMLYELGGGGERAQVVCGFLGCDERPFNPLLASLPAVIHLSTAGPQAAGGWLATLIGIAAKESGRRRAGGENILARLSELMFVETIREYIESLPRGETGWLAGLADPDIGRALAALHREPEQPWTVEGLARAVAMSRSALAERFAEVVGQPPIQYLAMWRMQLASRLLIDGHQVAEVSRRVGYESEAAFSRAFKKLVGQAPATWRKTQSARARPPAGQGSPPGPPGLRPGRGSPQSTSAEAAWHGECSTNAGGGHP